MFEHLPKSAQMGPLLLAEVERQLLLDLEHYDVSAAGLRFDWKEACNEGHVTTVLDGNLENLSDVVLRDAEERVVARGWIDFVHGGGAHALYVFWLFLSVNDGGRMLRVKGDDSIPAHVWEKLSLETKLLCNKEDGYDKRWAQDPKVRAYAEAEREKMRGAE